MSKKDKYPSTDQFFLYNDDIRLALSISYQVHDTPSDHMQLLCQVETHSINFVLYILLKVMDQTLKVDKLTDEQLNG